MENRVLVCALAAALLLAAGCANKGETTEQANFTLNQREQTNKTIEFVEIIHFHGNSQCYSCKTVGAYAEETINTYFKDEVASGKLVFKHVNYDMVGNKSLAIKYGVTGSSLWIGSYSDKGFSAEQNINVWYKIDDKDSYLTYLRGIIEDKLAEVEA